MTEAIAVFAIGYCAGVLSIAFWAIVHGGTRGDDDLPPMKPPRYQD